MNCRSCGAPALDIDLLCRDCRAKVSHKEILNMQGEWLPLAMRGYPPFRLMRRTGRQEWHIEMLGSFHGQAFCGVVFDSSGKKREWEGRRREYSKLDAELNLCRSCRAMLGSKAAAVAMEAK